VMAGVPNIMQAMLDDVAPRLRTGSRVLARTVDAAGLGEGIYAAGLAAIAVAHPAVSIGSYPAFQAGGFRNQIVLRSRDEAALEAAEKAVIGLIAGLSSDRAPV